MGIVGLQTSKREYYLQFRAFYILLSSRPSVCKQQRPNLPSNINQFCMIQVYRTSRFLLNIIFRARSKYTTKSQDVFMLV
jgi:hypothetical protein